MNTLKSAFAVGLMAVVLYGVYVVLNKPEERPLSDVGDLDSLLDGDALTPPAISDAPMDRRGFKKKSSVYGSIDNEVRGSVGDDEVDAGDETLAADENLRQAGYTSDDQELAANAAIKTSAAAAPDVRRGRDAEPESGEKDVAPVGSSAKTPRAGARRATELTEEQRAEEVKTGRERMQRFAFEQAFRAAKQKVEDGDCREALTALSAFHGDARLSADQQVELMDWLDALAGKVIYSRENWLAEAHTVRGGETLYDIADANQVPALLLQRINGVKDPEVLISGDSLKVVPGPFRAEVDLAKGEVTLFLGALYAGRFPFTQGDEKPKAGKYTVKDKRTDRPYYGADGVLAGSDPRNPYGGYWIDLGQGVAIHGSPGAPTSEQLGCIALAPRDAQDLYGILSRNSQVIVR